jgi:DNA-binding response OmpR family regulator
MAKILLLEDDEVLSETLLDLLESEGHSVTLVQNGNEALDKTFVSTFDIFILDVNVPFINGFKLLEELRKSGDTTPAIFITALTDIASLAKGFEVGADDYIKKPFEFDELLVRIQALLRKVFKTYADTIKVGKFTYNLEKNELYKNGEFVKLSTMELELTKLFFKNIDTTLPKEHILLTIGDGKEMSESSLRVHINKLRKIGLSIDTIKGVGYRLFRS